MSDNRLMSLHTAIITTPTEYEEKIKSLFAFDTDFDGTNGPEFTSETAKNYGYESDLDYHYDCNKEQYRNNAKGLIERILTESDCPEWEIDVIEHDQCFGPPILVIALVVLT